MTGSARSASSTASASNDRPRAIASGAGMAAGVDGQSAVRAGGTPGGEHALRLPGERHHLLGGGPEPRGRQLVRALVLVGRGLPRHDHELPLALVVAETELPDGPLRIARLLGPG